MPPEKSSTISEPANDNEGPFSIGQHIWPGVSKLIEEMGEVAQILGKLIATGGRTDHWSGLDLAAELENELGDLMAATAFLVDHNEVVLSPTLIHGRAEHKLALFNEWHGKIPQELPK